MKTAAIVAPDGTVENLIVVVDAADPKDHEVYEPPPDRRLVIVPAKQTAEIGGRWDGKKFTRPDVPEPDDDDERLAELRSMAEAGTLDRDDVLDAVRIALKRGRI